MEGDELGVNSQSPHASQVRGHSQGAHPTIKPCAQARESCFSLLKVPESPFLIQECGMPRELSLCTCASVCGVLGSCTHAEHRGGLTSCRGLFGLEVSPCPSPWLQPWWEGDSAPGQASPLTCRVPPQPLGSYRTSRCGHHLCSHTDPGEGTRLRHLGAEPEGVPRRAEHSLCCIPGNEHSL